MRSRTAAFPVGQLVLLPQNPVKGRFRRHISTFIGQAGDDLFGRQFPICG